MINDTLTSISFNCASISWFSAGGSHWACTSSSERSSPSVAWQLSQAASQLSRSLPQVSFICSSFFQCSSSNWCSFSISLALCTSCGWFWPVMCTVLKDNTSCARSDTRCTNFCKRRRQVLSVLLSAAHKLHYMSPVTPSITQISAWFTMNFQVQTHASLLWKHCKLAVEPSYVSHHGGMFVGHLRSYHSTVVHAI